MRTTHINAPKKVAAPGELYNATYSQSDSTYLTNTEQVYDYTLEKSQEEFNIEVAQAITSLQNLETVDSYSKSEIDSKVNLINQELANLATSLNTEYTRATTKESELAGRISNLETAAPNYITADSLEKYNSSKTVKFDAVVSSAVSVKTESVGLLSEYVIYYLVDRKTFAIANGPLVTPNPRVVYLNWVGRELYTSTDEFGNTTPYEDKLYIASNGIVYVWTGSELKSVGVDGLKAYYHNTDNDTSTELSDLTIIGTISDAHSYDSWIPSVTGVYNYVLATKTETKNYIDSELNSVNEVFDNYYTKRETYTKTEVDNLISQLRDRIIALEANSNSEQAPSDNTENSGTLDPETTVNP